EDGIRDDLVTGVQTCALPILPNERATMTARIYKPARTAMQSGSAKTKEWVLDYEPEQPRQIEPLMGWTSSGDMRQQVQLRFDSRSEERRVGKEWRTRWGEARE